MFWKLFGSERKVQEALEQSIGYDISPKTLPMPANSDTAAGARKLSTLEIDGGDTPRKKKA